MRRAIVSAGLVGVLTGLVVAAYEAMADEALDGVRALPLGARVAAPLVGLLLAGASLRWLAGGASPSTADEYIRTYHDDPTARLDQRPVLGRIVAALATIGLGGALGHEGPAIYAGAAVGDRVDRRAGLGIDDAKVLLVAGAAAGVAAIFKAPVTGLVFALEVPYRDDLARRMFLPAATAATASYATFAAFTGTDALLPVSGHAPFDLPDLAGAAAVGLACGILARAFAWSVARAKRVAARRSLVRTVIAGVLLAGVALAGHALTDVDVTLGPGYDAIRWAIGTDGLGVVLAAGTLRVCASLLTLAGGGVGGLFVPLVVQGAFVGQVVAIAFEPSNATLFPVLGIAAFLGAGYRVPLAAVVFVAELTGRPGFVVPGLVAAVVSQLTVGSASVSPYQRARRAGHLEARLGMSISTVLDAAARTVPPDASLEELFWQHLVGGRERSVAVVDGDRYVGLVGVDEIAAVGRDRWATTSVGEVVRRDAPVASLAWSVGGAVRAMHEAGIDRLAVCDGGVFLGSVSAAAAVALGELLERTTDDPPG